MSSEKRTTGEDQKKGCSEALGPYRIYGSKVGRLRPKNWLPIAFRISKPTETKVPVKVNEPHRSTLPLNVRVISFIPPAPGQSAREGVVIGNWICPACKMPNYVRIDAEHRVYGCCDYQSPANENPCGAMIFGWGREHSAAIIQHWLGLPD